MKDSDQVLNANQENITFRLQIPLSQKKKLRLTQYWY